MLAAGTRIGPYEIRGPLGAGGMGEVYRAADTRLGRDVALKVLAEGRNDEESLRRFEQEARATGALAHDNIVAVHDAGMHEGTPYLVTELLEGRTLREMLSEGPLPLRRALLHGAQLARGLAAAHARGVVHRDLKPENAFVTADGRLKILDFGIAKLLPNAARPGETAAQPALRTSTGAIVGTVGYMSPEQVRGKPADARSDIFSLGCVLHEMLSGLRAFRRDTPVHTATAILDDEPPSLAPPVPPAVAHLVARCLEKDPGQRFQSALDVAFDLEGHLGLLSGERAPQLARARRRWPALAVVVLALLAAGAIVGARLGGKGPRRLPTFHRLSFDSAPLRTARFAPDGFTVIYTRLRGDTPELVSTRVDKPGAYPLGVDGLLLSASQSGELAVLLGTPGFFFSHDAGTLARVPLLGGLPRKMLADAVDADWSPDSSSVAVVRRERGRERLEFPPGKLLFETAGWITTPRVAPRGGAVAFLEHPVLGDDRGYVTVADGNGVRRLTPEWDSCEGIAWSRSGEEVWFTAAHDMNLGLHAVTLAGRERMLLSVPERMVLDDLGPGGSLLARFSRIYRGTRFQAAGQQPRELGWLDDSEPRDLSPDGKVMLLSDWVPVAAARNGAAYGTYLRRTDGSPAVLLGEGMALKLSPDGAWALSLSFATGNLALLPTGAGEAQQIPRDGKYTLHSARWFPDGKRLLVEASEPGKPVQLYRQRLDAPGLEPVANGVGWRHAVVAPDGAHFAAADADGAVWLAPLGRGAARALLPAQPQMKQYPLSFTSEGRYLFALRSSPRADPRIVRVDVASGAEEPWRAIGDGDAKGLGFAGGSREDVVITPDGSAWAYTVQRTSDVLQLVEGLE
jgi:hypothetical protein